jgi:predicted DNA-binding protein
MLSARLPGELEKKVRQLATTEGRTKTEIIRTALEAYIRSKDQGASPYELGKDLFGRHGSGRGDLSTAHKNKVKDRLREKRSR